MEEKLWKACEDGKVEEVRKLLQNEQRTTWYLIRNSASS